MCENCFDNEIKEFTASSEFALFDDELKKKLHSEKGLFYIRRSIENKFYEYDIYGCKNCTKTWCLNVPNATNTGFLLLEENCQLLIAKTRETNSRWRTGIVIFWLMVMFACFLYLVYS